MYSILPDLGFDSGARISSDASVVLGWCADKVLAEPGTLMCNTCGSKMKSPVAQTTQGRLGLHATQRICSLCACQARCSTANLTELLSIAKHAMFQLAVREASQVRTLHQTVDWNNRDATIRSKPKTMTLGVAVKKRTSSAAREHATFLATNLSFFWTPVSRRTQPDYNNNKHNFPSLVTSNFLASAQMQQS